MFSFPSCGQDIDLVSHVLEVEDYNVESAIFAILQVKEGEGIGECTVCHLGLWVTVMLVLGTETGQVGFVCCHLSFLCSGRLVVRAATKKPQDFWEKELADSAAAPG